MQTKDENQTYNKKSSVAGFLQNISDNDLVFMRDLMEGGCKADELHYFLELKYKIIQLKNDNNSKEDIISKLNMNSDIYEIVNNYC